MINSINLFIKNLNSFKKNIKNFEDQDLSKNIKKVCVNYNSNNATIIEYGCGTYNNIQNLLKIVLTPLKLNP